MKWPFLLLAVIFGGLAIHGLITGTVIANEHWPNANREKQPLYYWTIILGYTAMAAFSIALAMGMPWPSLG